ncbi:TPA: hypothetical protein N2N45_002401 [Klebsiella aerogenes]|nr:hypothetical protein [Klebsiella aerogenes]
MNKKHSYELELNKLKDHDIISMLHCTEEEANTYLNYQKVFGLFDDGENAYINLEELWSVLEQPYGRYDAWLDQKVIPYLDSRNTEISVFPGKRKGRGGKAPVIRTVTTDTAKRLAMKTNTDAGELACDYFLLVEKLLRRVCEYNKDRFDMEKIAKECSHSFFKKGNPFDGGRQKARINALACKVAGSRNSPDTDYENYKSKANAIKELIIAGNDDNFILSAFGK